MKYLVFAPNWLGDAVMALPAVADIVAHAGADGQVEVAARPSVAGLFACVGGIAAVRTLPGARGGLLAAVRADADVAAASGADVAILFPNSIRTALVARRAGIRERCGYRHQGRGVLLTRAIAKPRGSVHQADYYRALVRALGIANGSREPRLQAPAAAAEQAIRLLTERGWRPGTPLVGLAPGAAFGGAKRWLPERFAAVSAGLAQAHGMATVIVGSAADGPAAWAIAAEAGKIIDLTGRTTLAELVAVVERCAAFVSNDSGAMHVAAAAGVPVAALFGPTNERETAPIGSRAAVLTAPVWCRPCMLRECPLDHRCMTGIGADEVIRRVGEFL